MISLTKRRIIPWLLVALAIASGIVWHFFVREPVIRFVGIQYDGQNRMALFRIENNTPRPFAYLGLSQSHPRYSYRFPTPSDWRVVELGICSCAQTIPARTSVDFQVPFPKDPGPFQIGLIFKPGTDLEFYQPRQPDSIRYLLWRIGVLQTSLPFDYPTWSATIDA